LATIQRPYNPRFGRTPFKREPEHKINEKILALEVRVVGENIEPGVYTTKRALEMAIEKGLDLVEISGTATPPVCRLVDSINSSTKKRRRKKK
jgi:translation initiation factor IF-3